MATLILTAVGTAVGGPIGGAIGAIIGQQADALIFAPKARRGPRLGDLAVQTSSYGAAIPKIFGRMRVAGTVIWATDLIELATSEGGGKGKHRSTSYSYSASFAVAISGRPVRSVGRIWADGKLLRGAAGDFKVETEFRLHPGGEDQAVDPAIAAAEGGGGTSAFRGIAYAMFENLELADYGNRIPSLSFEVEADIDAPSIGEICASLGEGLIDGGATPELTGFAAAGDSVRGAVEALVQLVPLTFADDGQILRLSLPEGNTIDLLAEECGASASADDGGRTEITARATASLPQEVEVAYSDPARDWQTSLQRATLGGRRDISEEVALPAALDASGAKAIVERRLDAICKARLTGRVSLPWHRADLRPGALVRLEQRQELWRVERWSLEAMVVTLDLVRVGAGTLPAPTANAGRPTVEPDEPHGPTMLALLDLPPLASESRDRPRLHVAASGVEAAWRRAGLQASFDGGSSWRSVGRTAAAAIMGTAATAIGAAGSTLIDTVSTIDVALANPAMWLTSCDDDALVNGANLAILGMEMIQFGEALPLESGRFRLSRLLRGRRGTEWAIAAHEAGERFVMIDPASLAVVEVPEGMIGSRVDVLAHGVGDTAEGANANLVFAGEALRPPSPVHVRAVIKANGDIQVTWMRRSRGGWAWTDGTDAPLSEESERYRVILAGSGFERVIETGAAGLIYTAAEQEADGEGTLSVTIRQLGTFAPSRAATMMLERP